MVKEIVMPAKTDHDRLVEIHAVLLGANGQGGVARKVERNSKAIFRIWVAIVVLSVSAGGGAFGIIKAFLAVNGG